MDVRWHTEKERLEKMVKERGIHLEDEDITITMDRVEKMLAELHERGEVDDWLAKHVRSELVTLR